ncbi:MAG: S8 family serine peptidase [Bacteroidota bacterium]
MIKKLLLILLVSFSMDTIAQNRYVILFTDKNNTPFTIGNPQAFLSPRSINRRAAQGINITTSDLPVDPDYIQQVAAISGVTVLNHSKWFNSVTVDLTSPSVLTAINALPFVVNSVNVGRHSFVPSAIDKFGDELKGPVKKDALPALRTASFDYGNATNQTQMININALHDLGYSGQGMIIAVIDGGFQDANLMSCFDSLFMQNRLISTWDFVSNDVNVFDDNWHGTAVLSTMAANIPGDMIGTAPRASYILLRSEDVATENIIEEYNWSSAAEYADSAGADVITSSLGYTEFDDPSQNHTYQDMDGNTAPGTIAADLAASKGILVVNSAGNSGGSSWNYIGCPADGDSVLAIGAVDGSGMYAGFSSQGPSFDGRVKPDVTAQGQGTTVYEPGIVPSTQSNGTSFSGPIIAGAVTCLWQRYPAKNNMEITDAVKASASQFTTPDGFLGYGIPDFGAAVLLLGGYEPSLFNDGLAVIDFFPNPLASGQTLNYQFFSRYKETIDLDIIDMNGKKMAEQKIIPSSTIIPIEIDTKLPAGIYFIRAITENKSVIQKLVIY